MTEDACEWVPEVSYITDGDPEGRRLPPVEDTESGITTKVKTTERDILEGLFDDEFVLDNPPESFERYEAELSVRHLRNTIEALAIADNEAEIEVTDTRVEAAIKAIDVMATYGKVAEPHLSALSRTDLPEQIYKHAIEVLGELREDQEEAPTIREAFARWLSP